MRNIPWGILLIPFLFLSLLSLGQQNGVDRIIPPSPTAASLGRFGDLQMGLYTGTAAVNIPIYTLEEGDIKLPISLSGSARAFTVSEVPGWVGAGFSLEAGGVITRSTMGLPDDLYSPTAGGEVGFLYNFSNLLDLKNQLANQSLTPVLHDKIISNTLDVQPDVYSYNFHGYSGRLYIDPNGGSIYSYSHNNIQFTPQLVTKSEYGQERFLESWTAKTPDGFEYTFSAREWTSSSSVIGTQTVNFAHVSSWFLTSILSPTGRQVNFGYTSLSPTNFKKRRLQEFYFDKMGKWATCTISGISSVTFGTQLTAPGTSETEGIYLSQIIAGGTTISFETSKRNDLYQQYTYATINPDCANPADCQEDRKLDRIIIKNYTNNIVNQFTLGYNENPSHRLQLTSITETGKPAYLFEYNGNIPVTYSSKQIDHWGYYNGAPNTNLIPVIQITNIPDMNGTYGYANREPSYNNTKLGSLKKVTYPTGGHTTFEYQQNDYAYVNDQSTTVGNKACGGLRVSKVKTYDPVAKIETIKEYDYTASGIESTGVIGAEHTYQIYLQGIYNNVCQRLFWVQSNSQFPLSYTSGNFVGYKTVTEKLTDGSSTVYDYESFYEYPDGTAVFSYPFTSVNSDAEILQFAPRTSMDHMRGKVKRIAYYNNSNQLIKEQSTHYSIKTANAHEQTFFAYTGVGNPPISGLTWPHPISFAILIGYKQKSQWVVKEYEIEKDFDLSTGNVITKRTDFSYDNPTHLQLTKITQTRSDQMVTEKVLRYPGDIISAPTTEEQNAINYFLSSKIYNRLLEEEIYTNGLSTRRIRNSYQSFVSQGFPWKQKIAESQFGNPLQTLVTFNSYDNNGNLLSQTDKSGITKKYIWDYNNDVPIAEVITGSNAGDIAYTSFEAEGMGGWNIQSGGQIRGFGGITGKKSLSGEVKKTVSTGSYIVSVWGTGNTKINGELLTSPPQKTIGQWKYYEKPLSNVSEITVQGDNIDEVRAYPVGTQMSTYTFLPLLGITSQCDAQSKIIYYEYDEANRLALIRDESRHILKKYCYNYQGQQDQCGYFYNDAMNEAFTRSTGTCPYPSYGSQVVYAIEEGRYFSTVSQEAANQKALDDIAQNGQNYANTYGACIPATIYAVVSAENIWYDGTTEYGDIVVRFYSDEECTRPFSVQNLPINIRETYHGDLCGCNLNMSTYTVNCNGFASVIAGSAILYEEVWQAEVDYRYRIFELLTGSGYVGGN